jgi:citrate lyase subunit beta/citryl-CoA lyase
LRAQCGGTRRAPSGFVVIARLREVRSALFLPASNPRAIEKARGAGADLVVLDLEDAVKEADKDAARAAAVDAVRTAFGGALVAIRVNGTASTHHAADCEAVRGSQADVVVLPMVEDPDTLAAFAAAVGKPVLAMIETPRAVLQAAEIARAAGVVGLIAGTNDLCAATGIRNEPGRAGLVTALQTMVLAARAAGSRRSTACTTGWTMPKGSSPKRGRAWRGGSTARR